MKIELTENQLSDLYDALDEAADSLANYMDTFGYLDENDEATEATHKQKLERWAELRTIIGGAFTASLEATP